MNAMRHGNGIYEIYEDGIYQIYNGIYKIYEAWKWPIREGPVPIMLRFRMSPFSDHSVFLFS